MMTTKEIGNIGEDYTAQYLKLKGYKILDRNYTIRGGEIDIIAVKSKVLHIVEVKSRKPDPLTSVASALTHTKIYHIIRTTQHYIRNNDLECSEVFDVAIVEIDNGKVTDFQYYDRAFDASSR